MGFSILLGLSQRLYSSYYCETFNASEGYACHSSWTSSCNCSSGYTRWCCNNYYNVSCVNNNCVPQATWTCSYYPYNYCYDSGTWCAGSCGSCSLPSCNTDTGYSYTSNTCSTYGTSCNRYYANCGSLYCGQSTGTCYRLEYLVTIQANGGTCSPDDHNVCGDASSSNPGCSRAGYTLTGYSLTSGTCGGTFTSSTGVCDSVTQAIEVTANWTLTNNNPNAPSSLETEGATNPTGVSDTTPEFSAVFSDTDSSDTGNYYQIQVNTASDFNGTSMWDSNKTAIGPITNGARSSDISYAGSTLSYNGTTYYWRMKFWDNNDGESAWSSTANFTMDAPPTAPTVLYCEGSANPTNVQDTTPEFSALCQDPDTGNTCDYYQIEVNTASDFTGTEMWNSGLQSMTATAIGSRSPDISYAGTTLSHSGTTYYWRIKFADNYGAVGAWSTGTNTFTMLSNDSPTAPTTPYCEAVATPLDVTDTTPEFSAVCQDSNTGNTCNYYEIDVNTASDFNGTSMWASGLQSMTATAIGARIADKSYAGTTLTTNGTTYYWRIRFADNYGAVGAWATGGSLYFVMRGVPTTPTDLLCDGNTNPNGISTLTPTFSAIHHDPNGSAATYYQIEVNSNSSFTGTVMWNTGQLSTSVNDNTRSSNYTYAGTALTGTSGTTYYWRIRFWDSFGAGAYSSTNTFVDNLQRISLKGISLKGLSID